MPVIVDPIQLQPFGVSMRRGPGSKGPVVEPFGADADAPAAIVGPVLGVRIATAACHGAPNPIQLRFGPLARRSLNEITMPVVSVIFPQALTAIAERSLLMDQVVNPDPMLRPALAATRIIVRPMAWLVTNGRTNDGPRMEARARFQPDAMLCSVAFGYTCHVKPPDGLAASPAVSTTARGQFIYPYIRLLCLNILIWLSS